jgi:N-acetyl-anhydromuramyl-L-alanine amidase AmpD
MIRECEGIIWHHSFTEDDFTLPNVYAIDKYHTSWRYNGKIITEKEALELIKQGVETVERPWRSNGYNYLIEKISNKIKIYSRRNFNIECGAHTNGKNCKMLGVCIIGNFDATPVPDDILDVASKLGAALMKQYNTTKNYKHRDFAPYKSCPGNKFQWKTFLTKIAFEYLFKHPILNQVLENYKPEE